MHTAGRLYTEYTAVPKISRMENTQESKVYEVAGKIDGLVSWNLLMSGGVIFSLNSDAYSSFSGLVAETPERSTNAVVQSF